MLFRWCSFDALFVIHRTASTHTRISPFCYPLALESNSLWFSLRISHSLTNLIVDSTMCILHSLTSSGGSLSLILSLNLVNLSLCFKSLPVNLKGLIMILVNLSLWTLNCSENADRIADLQIWIARSAMPLQTFRNLLCLIWPCGW